MPWPSLVLPVPPHVAQVVLPVPGLAPEPPHVRAVLDAVDLDLRGRAFERLLEAQVEPHLHVAPALRLRSAGPRPRPPPKPPPNTLPNRSPRSPMFDGRV